MLAPTLLASPNEAIELIQETKPRGKAGNPAVYILIDNTTIMCTAGKAIKVLENVASGTTFKAFTNGANTLTIKAHARF